MDWERNDLIDCTRYGLLYLIKQVKSERTFGLVRVRRRKDMFYEAGKLQWRTIRELDINTMPPVVGDFLFESQDKAVSIVRVHKKAPEHI